MREKVLRKVKDWGEIEELLGHGWSAQLVGRLALLRLLIHSSWLVRRLLCSACAGCDCYCWAEEKIPFPTFSSYFLLPPSSQPVLVLSAIAQAGHSALGVLPKPAELGLGNQVPQCTTVSKPSQGGSSLWCFMPGEDTHHSRPGRWCLRGVLIHLQEARAGSRRHWFPDMWFVWSM